MSPPRTGTSGSPVPPPTSPTTTMRSLLLLPLLAVTAACAATNPSPPTSFVVTSSEQPLAGPRPPAATLTTVTATEPTTAPVDRVLLQPSLSWSGRRKDLVRLEVFRQDIELGEIEYEPEDAADFSLPDVDRKRAGLRAAFGSPNARGYVHIFGEELRSSLNQFDEILGIGGGVAGKPTVHEFGDQIRLILPYRLGLNFAGGEEDLGVIEENIGYIEFEGEIGFGGYFHGVQPSVGLYVSSLAGRIEVEDHITNPETDFDGSNSGGFLQLEYKHDEFPLFGRIRAMGGDVEGILVSFGASF